MNKKSSDKEIADRARKTSAEVESKEYMEEVEQALGNYGPIVPAAVAGAVRAVIHYIMTGENVEK